MDASDRVRSAGFEPLEPYPGNNRTSWRCRHIECGNEVVLKLGGIVSGKNPCKYCNGQWVDPEKAAELMRQAGLEPLEPYVSNKHRWSCKCSTCGEVVTPQYASVLSQGSGCKFCGKNRAGEKRRVPEREAIEVMRAAGYEPLEPYVNSGHQWKCRCLTCGKETTPSYGEARIGSRCKFCANKAITPEDAVDLMRRGGFEPLEPYPGSMNPWMCRHNECGEIMSPRYAHVQQGRRGCQQCSKKFLSETFSLDADEAVLIMQSAGLEPLEPYPGNNQPWRCKHLECGREVTPMRASIQQGQGGCKPCHQQRLSNLYRTSDDVALSFMREGGFEPRVPYPGQNNQPWESQCTTCERIVTPTLANVRNGATCLFCSGKRLDVKEVEALMLRAGLEPLEPYPGRNSEDWRCRHLSCGREVVTRYSLVRDGNSGCVFCNGGRIHADDAIALMKQRGLEPLEEFPGANKQWKCKHLPCGRTVTPTYSNISQGGGGCKACSDSSFAYEAPGIIYLMLNEPFASIKVGITTEKARTDRIRDHQRGGWTLIEKWGTPSGLDAEIIESAILAWWRKELGAPIAMKSNDMPSGGFTETAALIHVDVQETKKRIEHFLTTLEG